MQILFPNIYLWFVISSQFKSIFVLFSHVYSIIDGYSKSCQVISSFSVAYQCFNDANRYHTGATTFKIIAKRWRSWIWSGKLMYVGASKWKGKIQNMEAFPYWDCSIANRLFVYSTHVRVHCELVLYSSAILFQLHCNRNLYILCFNDIMSMYVQFALRYCA